ncbi:pantoate--beta-alanine ligase [Gemmatimonadota bacterium]
MLRLHEPSQMREWSRSQRSSGHTIAFVPTMGALHAGHLSLVDLAAEHASRVVVSIFVNPAQFGEGEDLDAYPRDLDRDVQLLSDLPVEVLFLPARSALYPDDYSTWVEEKSISGGWEGATRPDHFRGVTTIVTRLLLAVEPEVLVLGQKDAQQVAVISRMIRDLLLPVEVVTGATVRESDGLALSSRNAYLSGDERGQAVCLFEALSEARRLVSGGEVDPAIVTRQMRERIEREPDARIDYLAALDPITFEPVDTLAGRILFCLAVHIGGTRLIDNDIVEIQSGGGQV